MSSEALLSVMAVWVSDFSFEDSLYSMGSWHLRLLGSMVVGCQHHKEPQRNHLELYCAGIMNINCHYVIFNDLKDDLE